jgi:hypothetical protein
MNVIALNESMSLSDSHDGAFVNSDYLTDALGFVRAPKQHLTFGQYGLLFSWPGRVYLSYGFSRLFLGWNALTLHNEFLIISKKLEETGDANWCTIKSRFFLHLVLTVNCLH